MRTINAFEYITEELNSVASHYYGVHGPWFRRLNRAPIFAYCCCYRMCLRIGRTRLVGGKNFLKIKYGVATLQKRALFHNRWLPNTDYTLAEIGFRVSTSDVHSLLTSGQHYLDRGVTTYEDPIRSRQTFKKSPGRRCWRSKDPTGHDFKAAAENRDRTLVIHLVSLTTAQQCLTQVGTNSVDRWWQKWLLVLFSSGPLILSFKMFSSRLKLSIAASWTL